MSERKEWLDILKGIAIIGVVAGHCDVCANFFSVFHVPLFFFVSGLLSKDAAKDIVGLVQRCLKHLRNYWVPFVVLEVCALLLHNFFFSIGWYVESIQGISPYLTKLLRILTFGGGEQLLGALWFLISLCEMTCLAEIILFALKKLSLCQKILAWGTICVALCLLGAYTKLPRNFDLTAYFFPYYTLGHGFRSFLLQSSPQLHTKKCFLLPIGLIPVFLAIFFNRSYMNTDMIPLTILCAVSGIMAFVLVSIMLAETKLGVGLSFIGRQSFYIMSFHFIGFKCYMTLFFSFENRSAFPIPKGIDEFDKLGLLFWGICVSIILGMLWRLIQKRWSTCYGR